MDAAAITAVGGIFIGIVTIFLKFVTDNQKSQAKRDEVFIKNMQENTAAMNSVARATAQSAKEAKERNGHLAELQLNSQAMIDRNYEAVDGAVREVISHINNQEVRTQHVDKQIIAKK